MRDFPVLPTLPAGTVCDGLAFLQDGRAAIPDLRPLREEIREIRMGMVGVDDGWTVMLAVFERPLTIDPMRWPGALPLIGVAPSTLRSFADRLDRDAPPPSRGRSFRRLELRWGGTTHSVATDALTPVSLVSLWDLPPVTIHAQSPRIVRRVIVRGDGDSLDDGGDGTDLALRGSTDGKGLAVGTEGAGQGKIPSAAAKVSVASPALQSDAEDFQDYVRARLGRGGGGAGGVLRRLRERLRGSAADDSGDGEATSPRGGNPLGAMFAWIKWNTPLGDGLRRQFGERLSLVERLIASGKFDEALRYGLKVGGNKDGGRSRMPGSLPPPHARLDFDISLGGVSYPILDFGSFVSLKATYRDLAGRLEREGDFRRAAFIRAQLLGEHEAAVLTLERGKLYADAARLALRAQLDPVLAIRMLYLAEDRDAALALARRAGCFDALAEDSREHDPDYHAYVVHAWTEMLAGTGQWLRALQVTDDLASQDPDDALLVERHAWLEAAMDRAGARPGAELIVRALLASTSQDVGGDLERFAAFPAMAVDEGAGPFELALSHVQAAARDEGDAADMLLDLLDALMRLALTSHSEQQGFWKGVGPALIDGIARAAISVASGRMQLPDLEALQSLLRRADQPVLAGDLDKLHRLTPRPSKAENRLVLEAPDISRPAVRIGCILTGGDILAWRDGDLLELRDRHGRLEWQMRLPLVVAMVPIGSSNDALVIQSRDDEFYELSRMATRSRTLYPIGAIPLLGAHDLTTDTQWLVQIDEQVGALDLVKLCAPESKIEYLWACQLGKGVRTGAFAHYASGAGWITIGVGRHGAGVMEKWQLTGSGQLTSHVCLPSADESDLRPQDWFWDPGSGIGTIGATVRWMSFERWSEKAAAKARHLVEERERLGIEGVDRIQPCDLGRPYVDHRLSPKLDSFDTRVTLSERNGDHYRIHHPADLPLRCIARAPAPGAIARDQAGPGSKKKRGALPGPGATALLADDHGRMILVDPGARRVTLIP